LRRRIPIDLKQLARRTGFWRLFVQWSFFVLTLFIGIRFGLFVRHFETAGATPFVSRPPGVEGFLPIGALVSLKHWLATGIVDIIHPAALVLFLTIVGMSLLAKKSFCSWLCPVGTLSEAAWKGGRGLFGRNLTVWRWLDLPLRVSNTFSSPSSSRSSSSTCRRSARRLRHPLLGGQRRQMLHFFSSPSARPSPLSVLTGLSFLYKNFWCRYLCPYGALLGLASLLSPFKVRRDASACKDCGRCRRACPAQLPVDRRRRVASAECTGCLTCTETCPQRALAMAPPLLRRRLPAWVFPVAVVCLFAAGVGGGMLTGHWQTSLTNDDYRQLIPMAAMFGH
jgi:polyferredoxin